MEDAGLPYQSRELTPCLPVLLASAASAHERLLHCILLFPFLSSHLVDEIPFQWGPFSEALNAGRMTSSPVATIGLTDRRGGVMANKGGIICLLRLDKQLGWDPFLFSYTDSLD